MKNFISIYALLLILTSINSCTNTTAPEERQKNPYVHVLRDSFGKFNAAFQGDTHIGVWVNDSTIFTSVPFYKIEYDKNYNCRKCNEVKNPSIFSPIIMSINKNRDKIIYTTSLYADICLGGVVEYDINAQTYREVFDTSSKIQNVVYAPDNQDEIIYYTLGFGKNEPGYYRYNLKTKINQLILKHLSG